MTGPVVGSDQTGPLRRRILFVPVLFHPEPWNGIMEHLLALIGHLDRSTDEPLIGVRPDDGPQTTTLARRVDAETVELGPDRSVGRLRRVFSLHRPDIVHVHTPSTSGLTALAVAARLARVPQTVVTLHQVAPDPLPRRSRVVNRIGQLLVDETLAVSSGAASTQSARAGLRRRSIDVVPNGVEDVGEATPPQPDRSTATLRAGYFGRLAAEKGVDVAIDAVATARERGVDIRLLVVGDGYERAALEQRAARAGVDDAVEFAGFREDARRLMSDVDVVVHVPRFEGFGLVVAEAMAAARPVIGSDVDGGIPDMVREGETGFLVPYGDVVALTAALERLANDPARCRALGAAGRRRYEAEFTVDRMVQRTLEHYVAGRRRPK